MLAKAILIVAKLNDRVFFIKKYLSSYPDLVKEWHPTKNGDLKPENLTCGSHKKVWWLCHRVHSYESAINRKTSYKNICPYCKEKRTLNYDLFK